jgi:hypothetical protein
MFTSGPPARHDHMLTTINPIYMEIDARYTHIGVNRIPIFTVQNAAAK